MYEDYLFDSNEFPGRMLGEGDEEYNLEQQCGSSGQQSGANKHIRVGIYDRNAPDGKYPDISKKNALLKALLDMMYKELLSDADIMPRFHWNGMVDNVYRCIAVGEDSAAFLKDRVERMPPPWPCARLQVSYKSTQLTKVEAYLPGELLPTPNLFDIIRQFDRMIRTPKWKQLDVRPHNQGHVYTFAIDADSYKWLDRCNGFIPYFDSGIEFRVLKDF